MFCRINYHYSVRASIEEPVPAKSYSTSVLEGWYNKNLDKFKIEQIKILYHDNTIRRIHIWEFMNLINRNTVEQKYIDLADVYNYE